MDMKAVKGAFIKRSRIMTSLVSGRLLLFNDATILYPDNKSSLIRSVLFSNYLNSQLELKKAYRIFMISFIIPVLVFQNGFFIIRRVNCVFGLYDGRTMRADIENILKLLRTYRMQVIITALSVCALGGFLALLGGGWVFFGMILIGWFGMVFLVSLFLRIQNLQQQMEELVDLDRNRWDIPEVPAAMDEEAANADHSEASTQIKVQLTEGGGFKSL